MCVCKLLKLRYALDMRDSGSEVPFLCEIICEGDLRVRKAPGGICQRQCDLTFIHQEKGLSRNRQNLGGPSLDIGLVRGPV